MPSPGTDETAETQGHSVAKEVDWEDFRDHLATADKDGNRRWIYPKKPSGHYYRWRTRLSWFLLAILFTGPFIRINGNPLLLFNIVERRFSFFGRIFWPQDTAIFVIALLVFGTGIIVFTAAFGRLWCGWVCPQTLLMEMVFRKLEYWIEGDARAQKALDGAPWSRPKLLKKTAKHVIFVALSFLIGNTLLSYIIGSEQLLQIVTDDPRRHLTGLTFMMLFTLLFYLIFARFREQACTFICPYGRFQSAMLDENSLVVAYDHRRGEMRGHLHRSQTFEARRNSGLGDCIDCHQCVVVCPTGIDIRNGTQMECVNCTACIDACDAVMKKIARPKGLIRYASLDSIEHGKPFKFTPRLAWYVTVLAALVGLLAWLVFSRSEVEATLLRAPGALFQEVAPNRFQNLYTVKAINKTTHDVPLEFRLQNVKGELKLMGGRELVVPRAGLAQSSILVELNAAELTGNKTKITIGIYAGGKRVDLLSTVFIGPRTLTERTKQER